MQNFSERQRTLDINSSFIVSAPAGSGKTTLLVMRYLKLLSCAKYPEEILAITFTKKAALQMRDRIYQALQNPETNDDLIKKVLERDKKEHWNLLKSNRFFIHTIDGFCNHLTQMEPIISGLGVNPNILEGQSLKECYKEAIYNLLKSLEEDISYRKELEDLLLHLDVDYQKIESLLIQMLSCRDQWLDSIVNFRDIDLPLENLVKENIEDCKKSISKKLKEKLFSTLNIDFPEMKNMEELQRWKKVADILLTKDYKWRKKISVSKEIKQNLSLIMEEVYQYEEFKNNLKKISLSPSGYSNQQKRIITSLTKVLKVLVGYFLRLSFQKRESVDYIEIALAAIKVLGDENPSELALKLDYKIQHILVDEFQDTSTTQYKLLEKLTSGWQNDGRTLFLVGDPMQSIYKFRQAKVGLFLKAKEGIGSIKLNAITLSTNFRANKNLIDWTNLVFSNAFPKIENISSGAVPFIPSKPSMLGSEKERSKIQIHAFKTKDYLIEAHKVLEIVEETIKNDEKGSIAILVRSRSHLDYILPALKKARIPYKGVELEKLEKNIHIHDLFSLTSALINENDRLSWLSILRAPWCSLSLYDLHVLTSKTDENTSFWQTISRFFEFQELSDHAKLNLERFTGIMKQSLKSLLFNSLRNVVENAWISLKGYLFTQKTDIKYVKDFFNLLDEIQIINKKTKNFLQENMKHLYAKPDFNTEKQLQIMTIHKAKGLEFDTVIVPGLNRKPKPQKNSLLMWTERLDSFNRIPSDTVYR